MPSERELLITRRDLLLAIAVGALAGGCASAPVPPMPVTEGRITPAAQSRVRPFALADVRLLDSPFLDAQQRDQTYLLSLEPDRLLHNFRVNAGLPPQAPIYGGWESVRTWTDIRAHGHTLGHYLSACSMMYASTGDENFKQRCDYIVAQLKDCQDAGKTGLVCAFPDGAKQFELMAASRRFVGVPWYTMHKILAGLRDVHLYCDNAAALHVLVGLCDWAQTVTQNMTDAQFQHMLNTEHGGMNEVLADVYVLTGDEKYLHLSQRFCHHAVLDPLAQGRDTLDKLHSNTQIPKFIGFARLHELTGEADYQSASEFFWQTVTGNRSFATGGNGDQEHFFHPADFPQHLSSAKTMETCCSYNMLRLTRMLFTMQPSAAYADYYERALYNSILASQDPDSGMMTYFQPTRPGYLKLYCTPVDSFWCCTGTGMENHSKYGDSIYFHDADALYVNLFIPSQLNWQDKGVTVTQTNRFPDEPRTKLTLAMKRPTDFTLMLRHPAWCDTVTVKINGATQSISQSPGSYIALPRRWQGGDIVEVELPMKLRAVPLPGAPDRVAFVYGPIVLCGTLGREEITPGSDIIINERTYGDVLNEPVDVPTFAESAQTILEQMRPAADQSLTFYATTSSRSEAIRFIPFFRVAHERYNLYWKVATPRDPAASLRAQQTARPTAAGRQSASPSH